MSSTKDKTSEVTHGDDSHTSSSSARRWQHANAPTTLPSLVPAPPSPADLGLSAPSSGLEQGNNVINLDGPVTHARAALAGRTSRSSHTSPTTTTTSITTTPTSNYVPSYGPSPNVQTREYPTSAGGGGGGSGTASGMGTGASRYTPYVVGGHHRGHHHGHHNRTTASTAADALLQQRTSSGSHYSTVSDGAPRGERGLRQTAPSDAVGQRSSTSTATRENVSPSQPQAASATGRTSLPPVPKGRSTRTVSAASSSSSSSTDGKEWVRTRVGGQGGDDTVEHGTTAADRGVPPHLRRLTTTSPGFGFTFPSSTTLGGTNSSENVSEEALAAAAGPGHSQGQSGATGGLLGVRGLGLPRNTNSFNASHSEGIYSLVPSGETSRQQTPVSPSMFMDRAYTSTEAQMAVLRQQHEDQRMREALRAAGVPLAATPERRPVAAALGLGNSGGSGSGGPYAPVGTVAAAHFSGVGSGGGMAGGAPSVAAAVGAAGGFSRFAGSSGGGLSPSRFATATAADRAADASTAGTATAPTTGASEEAQPPSASPQHSAAGLPVPRQLLTAACDGNAEEPAGGSGAYLAATPPLAVFPRSLTAPQAMATMASSMPTHSAYGAGLTPLPPSLASGGSSKANKTVTWRQQQQPLQLGSTVPDSPGSPLAHSSSKGSAAPPPGGAAAAAAAAAAGNGVEGSISGPDLGRTARSQSSASFAMNNSFGNVSFGNFSFLKDPLAASVVMQSNRNALIQELERRREKLKKQLALLQREATARNIFALVRSSNASQLQYLLQQKLCNVNERDYNGSTPLHVAASEGNQAVVSVLLSFGADVLAVDKLGRTPLDCAAANRHSGVGRYLLAAIRGKVQREGSVDSLPASAGGGAATTASTSTSAARTALTAATAAAGAAATAVSPPSTADGSLWPPRGMPVGSSPSNSVTPPASLDAALPPPSLSGAPPGFGVWGSFENPVTAHGARGEATTLLAPAHPLLLGGRGSPVHGGATATGRGSPFTPQHHDVTSSLGLHSGSDSLPVVATPSYLGGAGGTSTTGVGLGAPTHSSYGSGAMGGGGSMGSGATGVRRDPFSEGSLDHTKAGLPETSEVPSPLASATRVSMSAAGGGVGGAGVAPTGEDARPRTMLRPVRRPSGASGDGYGQSLDLLSPLGGGGSGTSQAETAEGGLSGANPYGASGSLGMGGGYGSAHTVASSFADVGMQTFDDYRHNATLIRSGWSNLPAPYPTRQPLRGAASASSSASPSAAAAGTNLVDAPSSMEKHTSAAYASGGDNTSVGTHQNHQNHNDTHASDAATGDSHASHMGASRVPAILHPWCSACGQPHASTAHCPAAASAAYNSYSDDFSASALANQRLVAQTHSASTSAPVETNKDIATVNAEKPGTLSTPTVAVEGTAEPSASAAESPLLAAPGHEVDGGGESKTTSMAAAEEDRKFTEAAAEAASGKDLRYSSYTTVSDTISLVVCMCGLPGRGKSFISKRLVRYMNWKGVPCKVFNAGNYRRQLLGVEGTANAEFFNPDNPQGKELRERMAELACEDLVRFLCDHPLAIGILDATNTTKSRRSRLKEFFAQEAEKFNLPYHLLFIESVCTDETIITENILRSKCDNDDFKTVKDTNEVIAEFRDRIVQYERVYETLEPQEGLSFIKIINVKHHVVIHKVYTGLGSRIAFFLMNLHPVAYPIYIALPGETKGDAAHVYGGDERLTTEGEAYAVALKHFIQDRYVPNMVVLHATNRSVLSTLQPLIADEEDDAFTDAAAAAAAAGTTTGNTTTGGASDAASEAGGGKRVSPTGWRATGGTPATDPALFLHAHHKTRHIVSPTSALEQPLRTVKVQAHTEEEIARLKRMAGGDLQDIPLPLNREEDAEEEAEDGGDPGNERSRHGASKKGTVTAAAAAAAVKAISPNSDGTHREYDEEEDEDFAEEVLVPVPGLDNINYGRFSGYSAEWVQKKYPRLSSLLYVTDSSTGEHGDAPHAHKTGGARDQQKNLAVCEGGQVRGARCMTIHPNDAREVPPEGQESRPVRPMRDRDVSDDDNDNSNNNNNDNSAPHHHDDAATKQGRHAYGVAGHRRPVPRKQDGSPTTATPVVTTPTTVAEILAHPAPPPTHFSKMSEALACLAHTPSNVDPRLTYCVQFPNGESCRQVNVRLEPALMAVMRTQSPVFVVAPSVPAEGMLAFFADVIPELSPTLRLPHHCVIEMGVKDDVTIHRLLPSAGADCALLGPASPVIDQGEIEETLKLATSIRSATHPFASSQNPETRPEV